MNKKLEIRDKILEGDALTVLKELPDNLVDCIMTSPPYWGLRDYGAEAQLGLEKTVDEYISKLCDIFDEAKRVLLGPGTCWVNLGDTYGGSWGNYGAREGKQRDKKEEHYRRPGSTAEDYRPPMTNLQDKCLCNIPARFSIEMCNRGWILRNVIIWHKQNCMPSSVKDRFTVDFEYLFFFVKQKKYYFEQQFDKTENSWNSAKGFNEKGQNKRQNTEELLSRKQTYGKDKEQTGRNKRAVWTINPKPYSEAHFAVYPEELCETPIKAGCPQFVCKKCGKEREKIYNQETEFKSGSGKAGNKPEGKWKEGEQSNSGKYDIRMGPVIKLDQTGWTDCGCNAGYECGIVLDPFMGSGTTGLVAKKLQRYYLGIELNPKYIKLAEKRIGIWLF